MECEKFKKESCKAKEKFEQLVSYIKSKKVLSEKSKLSSQQVLSSKRKLDETRKFLLFFITLTISVAECMQAKNRKNLTLIQENFIPKFNQIISLSSPITDVTSHHENSIEQGTN